MSSKFISKGYKKRTHEPTNNPKKNYRAKRKYIRSLKNKETK